MIVGRNTGALEHRVFRDIVEYLREGDVLVINDSKVIPARIFAKKDSNGIEIQTLLLRQRETDVWETIMRPGKRAKLGTTLTYGGGKLHGEVVGILEDGGRLVKFDRGGAELYTILGEIGSMPLPPYITEKLEDQSR